MLRVYANPRGSSFDHSCKIRRCKSKLVGLSLHQGGIEFERRVQAQEERVHNVLLSAIQRHWTGALRRWRYGTAEGRTWEGFTNVATMTRHEYCQCVYRTDTQMPKATHNHSKCQRPEELHFEHNKSRAIKMVFSLSLHTARKTADIPLRHVSKTVLPKLSVYPFKCTALRKQESTKLVHIPCKNNKHDTANHLGSTQSGFV